MDVRREFRNLIRLIVQMHSSKCYILCNIAIVFLHRLLTMSSALEESNCYDFLNAASSDAITRDQCIVANVKDKHFVCYFIILI